MASEVKQFCAMDELSCSGIAVSLIGIRWDRIGWGFGRIGRDGYLWVG